MVPSIAAARAMYSTRVQTSADLVLGELRRTLPKPHDERFEIVVCHERALGSLRERLVKILERAFMARRRLVPGHLAGDDDAITLKDEVDLSSTSPVVDVTISSPECDVRSALQRFASIVSGRRDRNAT
jgi:hypothetical protein